MGQGASPGASHSSLPGAQCPFVPLPAWSPGGERQLGPLVGSQNPLSLGSVALPIPVPLSAFLSSSVKWAYGHPCPMFNLPTPLSGPPLGTTTLFDCPSRSVGGHMTQIQ